jgi:hypothetical protein
MADSREQIEKIRKQFTRQADAYIRTAQATNEAGLAGLVALSGAKPSHAALDVDRCGRAVRREDGALRFSHSAVAFVAMRATR